MMMMMMHQALTVAEICGQIYGTVIYTHVYICIGTQYSKEYAKQ